MKTLFRLLLGCLVVASCTCGAQDLRSHMEQMKTAYTASGSIVALDGQTLVIEPNMPGPICAMPREEDGTIAWYRYAFPLSSITVPLADVDESLMSEDRVFTKPEAPKAYKPGDKGDAIMVVVVGMPGRSSAPSPTIAISSSTSAPGRTAVPITARCRIKSKHSDSRSTTRPPPTPS